ncbi:replication endonuclease [Janthinobacterium tructae]|uniref:Replication endonuclease n=1 Tax=Janthinobacterium tructae TaxID=2590869 RepID=A0A4Y6RKK2_9BURK|nr:replication endonuclease [Janthinobacterium tructae]QDG73501.1 replication endonuclease [Janthinobacterium tructae]
MLSMGIPSRMAAAVQSMFGGLNVPRQRVVDAVLADDQRLPLADSNGAMTGPGAISVAALQAARECYEVCARLHDEHAIKAAIDAICARRGVLPPDDKKTIGGYIARAADHAWWRRALRKELMRRFEHTSIQLGLTYVRADPYVSRETCLAQAAQNEANQKALAAVTAINEHGDVYSLAELAALGMGNKTLRRGELMLRIRGFEEVADKMRHVGMFWTVTCPSKYHSVGGTNAKYTEFGSPTPRAAQAYLADVWKRIRSSLHRRGIRPYGFRIAEPHTDGCPHWHMLLFVAPEHQTAMECVISAYAMHEDRDEPGAIKNRVKLVRIEAGKGTAAGYIAKYVSKNIDGAGVGDHKVFEDGRTYVIAPDMFGNMEFTASQRVTYWSQVWGIRQFQQIGGVPVGVWREFRRLSEESVRNAPEPIREAYQAAQKVESDNPAIAQRADFARFIRAMGGPTVGRQAAIQIAKRVEGVEGRYEQVEAHRPVGVYLAAQPHAVYESTRYRWTIDRAGVALAVPRTGVNNCSRPAWAKKNPIENPIGKNKNFAPSFYVGRSFDREGAPCARIDTEAIYLHHKKRQPGGPSAHLAHLQRKYKKE